MRERPAPDSLTLTPGERGLCIVLATLWGGVALLAIPGAGGLFSSLGGMFAWAPELVQRLLEGKLPVSSPRDAARFFGTCFLIGGAILGPLYLAYLVHCYRWLRPRALWFWTTMHWVLPVLYVLASLSDQLVKVPSSPRSRYNPAAWGAVAGFSLMPLTVVFFSQRAWRRRKSAGVV